MKIGFELDGKPQSVLARPGETLFEVLRRLGRFSVKYGSDRGECGSDTVLVDDLAFNASLLLAHTIEGRRVETIESLAGEGGGPGALHPLQRRFIEAGASQCGYCTPAMILAVEALLRKIPDPGEAEIRDALAGVLCRCTGYVKPVRAVLDHLRGGGSGGPDE